MKVIDFERLKICKNLENYILGQRSKGIMISYEVMQLFRNLKSDLGYKGNPDAEDTNTFVG